MMNSVDIIPAEGQNTVETPHPDPGPEAAPMKRIPCIASIALLAAAMTCPPSVAEEVESPLFKSWARTKPGTSITLKMTTDSASGRIETKTRYTLAKLDREMAIVELVSTSGATGEAADESPQEIKIRRMFPVLPGVKKEEIGKPSGAIAKGEETITIAGKEYKAQWYDTKGMTEAGESITRTWISDEVPGLVLKAVTRVPKIKKETTIELVELKAP